MLLVVAPAAMAPGCTTGGLGSRDDSDDPYRAATIQEASEISWFDDDRRSGPVHAFEAGHDALEQTEYYAARENKIGQGVPAGQATRTEEGAIVFNFVDTPVPDVVDIVLGDLLEQNYILDPQARGSVTMRTSRPLSVESALPTLQNLLALNGISLVRTEGTWHVLPFAKALQTPSLLVTPNNRDVLQGQAIHVIPLEYVPAESVLEVVRNQINPGREVVPVAGQDIVLFIGPAHEARILEGLISAIDVDQLAGRRFALVPVESASVSDVIQDVKTLFEAGETGRIEFLPIERLNAILIVSRNQSYVERAAGWIERLDRSDAESVRQIHVYHVRNGKAEELASYLEDLFPGSAAASAGSPRRDVAPGMTPVSLSTEGVSADQAERAASPSASSPSAPEGDNSLKIIADARNNVLIIRATPAEYRHIEATLARLDIMPLQVFIEAVVAEVTLEDDLKFGIEWYLNSGGVSGTFSTSSLGAVANSFPGFGFAFQSPNAHVVLNALDEITDVEVISSPKIMVMDNQSARLQVGDQVPVVTQTTESLSNSESVIVKSVQNVDTGIILDVTPTVNTGGLVTLKIMQEVSSARRTSTSDIDSPTFQTRRIESNLAVQSGETVALGGLIRDSTEVGVTGVPGVRNIPVLGKLFQSKSTQNTRTELVMLITPYVTRDPGQARQLTSEIKKLISTLGLRQ